MISIPDKYTPIEIKYLALISQYATDIHHIKSHQNTEGNAMLRTDITTISNDIMLWLNLR